MFLAIMIAVMSNLGIPTFTVDSTVYVTGRPGCTVQPLHGDPSLAIVVCK